MNQKRVLTILAAAFTAVLVLATGAVLLGSLKPSATAEPQRLYTEIRIADIENLPPGEFTRAIGPAGVVYLFKPTAEILTDLDKLDRSVFDPEIRSYVEELDVFVYRGQSTRFGCLLLHAPPDWPNWPGGFFDPCHDSSYDYAGRTLSDPDLAYSGFTKPVSNLYVPEILFSTDGVVRMYGNETQYDR